MPLPVFLFPAAENISARLAEVLASHGRVECGQLGVVLPTQRLQQYVRLELATRLTGCIPPKMFTLDALAAILPAPDHRRRIALIEQRLILNALLLAEDYRYVRPGMESDLARFFNELVNEDLHAPAFAKINTLLQQDPFRDERHLDRLLEQIGEIEALYHRYTLFLDQHQLVDQPRDFARRVRHAAPQPRLTSLWNVRKFYVAAFSDATRTQITLLRRLADEGDCEFWFHGDDQQRSDGASPFAVQMELIRQLGIADARPPGWPGRQTTSANTLLMRRAFSLPVPTRESAAPGPDVHLHSATTTLQEAKSAAALARDIIHAGFAEAQEIVVVVPNAARYGRLLWSVFEQAGIPLNYSLGMPLLQTRVGQWLRLLLEIGQNDWRLADLLSLFSNPFMKKWLDQLDLVIPSETLQSEIQLLAQRHDLPMGASAFVDAASAENHAEAMAFFARLQKLLSPFAGAVPGRLADWGEKLWQLTEDLRLDALVHAEKGGAYNLEARALNAWYASLQQVIRSGQLLRHEMPFRAFYSFLVQNVFGAEIRPAGEPHIGVQIMGMLEARSLPAKVLILVGNTEGSFPGEVGRELFLAEPLRAQLGLTTFHKREKLQDQQFYRLVAGIPHVHLFFSQQDGDAPAVKSRYLQRLELLEKVDPGSIFTHDERGLLLRGDFLADPDWPGRQTVVDFANAWQRIVAAVQQRADVRGNFPGNRQRLLEVISATALDHLLHCPYRFLLDRLGIGNLELPEEEGDSRQLGQWLHAVCQYFFQGLPERFLSDPAWSDLADPWRVSVDASNRDAALDRLRRLSRILLKKYRGKLDLLYHMHFAGWPQFLAWEIEHGPWQFDPRFFEYGLPENSAEVRERLGMPVVVNGRIDRIVRHDDEIRIVDYKLTRPDASRSAIEAGTAPQLPLYVAALRQTEPFREYARWSAEYYGLRTGEHLMIDDEPGAPVLTDAWQNLLTLWQSRVADILPAQKPLAPEEVREKCRHCPYTGVCRRQEAYYQEQDRKRRHGDT